MKRFVWVLILFYIIDSAQAQKKQPVPKEKFPDKSLKAKKSVRHFQDTLYITNVVFDSNTVLLLRDSVKYLENQVLKNESKIKDVQGQVSALIEDRKKLFSELSNYRKNEKDAETSYLIKNVLITVLSVCLALSVFCIYLLIAKRKKNQKVISADKPIMHIHQKALSATVNKKGNILKVPKERPITESLKKNAKTDNQISLMNTSHESLFSTEIISFSNIYIADVLETDINNKWFIVGASVTGDSHVKSGKPCDDNHHCLHIENNWGVAVTSDGAGSANNAHFGSELSAKHVAENIRQIVIEKQWAVNNQLPDDTEWENIAFEVFNNASKVLKDYATEKNLPFKSLACTLIVVVYSPVGLLVTHIGDGRAGYCDQNGEWKSIIIPHKGEEANETFFITMDFQSIGKMMTVSNVKIPESRVIRDSPTAFTLLTDGCEKHSFFCSSFDIANNKWSDPNIPSEKFFNSLTNNLKALHRSNILTAEANQKWTKFLINGTAGLKDEPDDKTMILGILL